MASGGIGGADCEPGRIVIENALVFALGALTAGILALLIFPAFTRRAARLARKAAEARLPRSSAEMAAAKDAVRAEYAARTARIEHDYVTARKALVEERLSRARDQAQVSSLSIERTDLQSSLLAAEARIEDLRSELRAREEAYAKLSADYRAQERRLQAEEARTAEADARADEAERLATDMRAALIAAEADGIALAEGRYRLAALTGSDSALAALPATLAAGAGFLPDPFAVATERRPENGAAGLIETAGNADGGADTDPQPLYRVTASLLAIRSAATPGPEGFRPASLPGASTAEPATASDAGSTMDEASTLERASAETDDDAVAGAGAISFPSIPGPAVRPDDPLPPEDHAQRVDDLARRLRSLRARNGAARGKTGRTGHTMEADTTGTTTPARAVDGTSQNKAEPAERRPETASSGGD